MSKRKQFTSEQKVAIIRRHLVENVPVSDLCDELGIHASQYYNWQKQLFENAGPVFQRRPNKAKLLWGRPTQVGKQRSAADATYARSLGHGRSEKSVVNRGSSL